MGAFLQLGPTATNAGYDATNRKAFLEAQAAAREAAALPDKLDVSYAQPTREMREELQAQGVVLPSADEEVALSRQFNAWLEQMIYDRNDKSKRHSQTWYNLFKQADLDDSGFITFDELREVVRQKLKKGPKVMSDQTLMALWCHLDLDDSNAIQMDEMGRFLRKGAAPKSTDASGPMQAAIMADYEDLAKLGATVSTLDIRAELAAAGVSLPDGEELLSLSGTYNRKLEEAHGKQTSWFNLFKEVDIDGSGFVTFDELERVTRSKLGMKRSTLSDAGLKALWCVLDEDNSNQVQSNEMAKFLKGKVAGFLIKNKASVVRLSEKELAAIAAENEAQRQEEERLRVEREEARVKWIEKMSVKDGESRARLAQQWRQMKAVETLKAERRAQTAQRTAYKREMLSEMRLRALRTPVSTSAKDGLTVPLCTSVVVPVRTPLRQWSILYGCSDAPTHHLLSPPCTPTFVSHSSCNHRRPFLKARLRRVRPQGRRSYRAPVRI